MTRRSIDLTDELYDYLVGVSVREPDVLRRLREETAELDQAAMQIGPEQGQLMALLLELIGARAVLEIGTFTGYSALVMALALPEGGRIVACDVSAEWTAVARRYWKEAGVAHKIDLRLGPALETIDALLAEGRAGTFDFVFVDADKSSYDAYYERSLELLRTGGLVAIDNVLWSGKVADPAEDDEDTVALRALNAKLKDDERVSLSLVPIGDGLTLAMKR
ncbi:MAG TPA: class I SAM-dependent methyltransferase [Longimicrobiales bacterium]|nr:class I SAM-dependent methyltransferase [Longimicrobiales bacterium]